jgi:predicted SAM-dependent methyltransferase
MRRALLFFFSHRLLALARWDIHFILLRLRNALTRQHSTIRKRVASARPIYLNLGSGPRGIADPCWINIDGYRDKNVQFLLDFTRPLPFADQSLDGIFCEHVFEHFTQEDGERLACELRRCLRPRGVARIIVPDAERVMRAYFDAPDRLIERRQTATAMEAVNSYFRQRYDHHFLYDWPTLKRMLECAGFSTIIRSKYKLGQLSSEIVLDDPKYEWESLYVEASPHQVTV